MRSQIKIIMKAGEFYLNNWTLDYFLMCVFAVKSKAPLNIWYFKDLKMSLNANLETKTKNVHVTKRILMKGIWFIIFKYARNLDFRKILNANLFYHNAAFLKINRDTRSSHMRQIFSHLVAPESKINLLLQLKKFRIKNLHINWNHICKTYKISLNSRSWDLNRVYNENILPFLCECWITRYQTRTPACNFLSNDNMERKLHATYFFFLLSGVNMKW